MSYAAFSRLVLPYDEPVELHPPVVNIQACGAKRITIGNLRSSPGPLTQINFQRYVYDSFGESLRGFLAREQLVYALGSRCGAPLASSSIVMVDTR
jgi:hypothetical protein